MKLVSYVDRRHPSIRQSFGAVVGTEVMDLASPEDGTLRLALAREGMSGISRRLDAADRGQAVALADVDLLAPIVDPGKILCIGLNYHLHAQEVCISVPYRPFVFVQFPSAFAAAGQWVGRPGESGRNNTQ